MKLINILFFLFSISLVIAHPKYPVGQYQDVYYQEEKADSLHGFDVLHYDISMQIDDQNQFLEGIVISTILAEEDLSEISFELEGLETDFVSFNGNPVDYVHENGLINMDLGYIPADEEFELTIHYSGNPVLCHNPYTLGMFFQTSGVFTISCPNASRYWWPCYDHPWDKALIDLNITVRDDWDVASNGIRTAIVDNDDGTRTHHWEGENPMATYLVSIVAREFVELNDWYDDIPIQNFVPPNMEANAINDFENLPLMMEIYSEKYGDYPFEKYGNAVTNFSTYGAMEHQTMSTLANYLITGNHTYETVIAHELSHQWFGNCLTGLTWKDVWLSEGFATYSEAVFVEAMEGYEAMLNYVQANIQNYYTNWAGSTNYTIYNPPSNAIFTPVTYEKAASVLHILRSLVGDDVFYEILQTYFQTYKHGNVITEDFKQICEQVSSLDLTQFFQQWIYEPGIPQFSYASFFSSDKIAIYAKTSSTSGTVFYTHIPVQVVFEETDSETFHIQAEPQFPAETILDLGDTSFSQLLIDPEHWIINRGYDEQTLELGDIYSGGTHSLITWSSFWDEIPVDGYHVYRALEENGNYQQISDEMVTDDFFYDENITLGQEYYYTVKAVKIIEDEQFLSIPAIPKNIVPLDFPMNQGILVVDESYDGLGIPGNPDDEMVDDFYQAIINYEFTEYDVAESGVLTLETMRHYSTIIYHDEDISQQLISNSIQDIGSYLLAGGNVFISGWKTVSSIPQSFYQTFTSSEEWLATTQMEFIGAYSDDYPDVSIDPDKVNPAFDGALMYVYTLEDNENAMYYYQGSENSDNEGKIVGIKENQLILLGFPLYYCYEEGASALINQVLTEFEETSSPETDLISTEFSCNAYPNPFNPNLTISYSLPKASDVEVVVYNVKGQKVNRWHMHNQNAGNHKMVWNGTNQSGQKVGSGVFFFRLKTNDFEQIQKVVLLK